MDLNPLLGEARVVDISNIKMDANERTVHLVEECPEFPGRQQEALFRITVLATDFDSGLGCDRRKLLHYLETAVVDLVVRNLLGHQPSHHKDGVATEQLSGLELPLDDANRLSTDARIARRERSLPMKAGRNVGDHQAGIFYFAAQLRHLRVRGVHLEPGDLAEPQLDTVVSGLLYQLEPLLETPTVRDHVVADRFFHGSLLISRTQPQSRKSGALMEASKTSPSCFSKTA